MGVSLSVVEPALGVGVVEQLSYLRDLRHAAGLLEVEVRMARPLEDAMAAALPDLMEAEQSCQPLQLSKRE